MCCPLYQMNLTCKRICPMRCVPINRSSRLSESPLHGDDCTVVHNDGLYILSAFVGGKNKKSTLWECTIKSVILLVFGF